MFLGQRAKERFLTTTAGAATCQQFELNAPLIVSLLLLLLQIGDVLQWKENLSLHL